MGYQRRVHGISYLVELFKTTTTMKAVLAAALLSVAAGAPAAQLIAAHPAGYAAAAPDLAEPQCTITSMVSVMTTVEQTSSRVRPEMVTQPLVATLSLFLTAGSRLSSTLTMETESSKM